MYYNGYCSSLYNCCGSTGCSSNSCCCRCCQEAFERGFRLGLAHADDEDSHSRPSCCGCSHRTYC